MKTIVQDYTYFQKNDIIYARPINKGTTLEFAVGLVLQLCEGESAESEVDEYKLWKSIKHSAKTNERLQKELDRTKILYYSSKKYGT